MLNEHKKQWPTPDGWTIETTDESIQVFDADDDPVIEAITKDAVLQKIEEHIKSQENHAAFELLMAALKDPIEA
jgi:DNA topoisomerase VI subunit A